jgi:hypothetical protein
MDLSTLAGAVVVIASLLVLIAVSRLSSEGPGLAELFRLPTDLGWPRGVQEEEPVRWRIELLEAPRTREQRAASNMVDDVGTRPDLRRAMSRERLSSQGRHTS